MGSLNFNNIIDLINRPIGLIKTRSSFIISFSLVILTLIYIFGQAIIGKEVIEVGQSPIIIKLPVKFDKCQINFDRDIRIGSYHIFPFNQKKTTIFSHKKIDSTSNLLIIENNLQKLKVDYLQIHISATINYPVMIQNIIVDSSKINLKNFYDNNLLILKKKYVDREYIRKDISLLLLKYNDTISNYILTFLTISLIPLSSYCLFLWVRLYIYSESYFKRSIEKNYSINSSINQDEIINAHNQCGIDFTKKNSWFRFLQIFGPAIGFALTISSLIAGLHPTLQTTQDISIFFESIQIAMISTFIGLIIRLISLLSQRANNKLFFRADEIFWLLIK